MTPSPCNNGWAGKENWGILARALLENETCRANAYNMASGFDHLNLILFRCIKNYCIKKKSHPQIKKIVNLFTKCKIEEKQVHLKPNQELGASGLQTAWFSSVTSHGHANWVWECGSKLGPSTCLQSDSNTTEGETGKETGHVWRMRYRLFWIKFMTRYQLVIPRQTIAL